ncbi:MAG TPA: glycosyltransferase [Gammaproteobacteria bacterium]|nr:glycosyltransferase [Gammaproteobacteria bacterium]
MQAISTSPNKRRQFATALIVPTLNAQQYLQRLIPALQGLDPAPDQILFIDSASNDSTVGLVREAGFRVEEILREDFEHGRTRNFAASLVPWADMLIFLSQDVTPVNNHLVADLVKPFDDFDVALVFARQTPYEGASVGARFVRMYRYPDTGYRRTAADLPRYGAMTAFCSNACAAYRRRDFDEVGGFSEGAPLGEDMSIAGKFIDAGKAIVYEAEALVYHSHEYTLRQEFTRYFDIGTHHRIDPWLHREGIRVGGEGRRYLAAEFSYTREHGSILDLIKIFPRLGVRWLGFRLGKSSHRLPTALCRRLSMHASYWIRKQPWRP